MTRILMMPHAPGGTLAHVAACSAVADGLRDRGHEPVFAYGGTRPELLERAGFDWYPVIEQPGALVPEWYDTPEELEGIVVSQLEVIDRERPAVCVTSSGLGGVAAQLAGVPELALMHGLAGSPYGRPALIPWMARDAARHPARVLGHLRSWRARRKVIPARAAIVELRRRLGLPAHQRPAGLVDEAAAVACTTAPFVDPARKLPPHWHYVGALDYAPSGADGASSSSSGDEAPRAYISQGSTGSAELLRAAVGELSAEGFEVVVSTGGLCDPTELRDLGPRVSADAIGDTRSELQAADIAVIAGGHMTAMQALLTGTPTVVIPHTRQQSTGALRADRLGTGVGLWPRLRPGAIARAGARMVQDQGYATRAGALAERLREGWVGNENAAALAESVVSP